MCIDKQFNQISSQPQNNVQHTVLMSLQRSRDSLRHNVRANVQILELGVSAVGIDDKRVLLDQILREKNAA